MLIAPEGLPAEVSAEFDRLAAMLDGRLRPEDAYLVTLFATNWKTWQQCQADIAAQGCVVMSGGTPCPHPALAVAKDAQTQLVTLAAQLGLSPAARQKLRLVTAPESKPSIKIHRRA